MYKWLKRIFIALATVVVVLVLAVLALPFLINPNTLKGPIQQVAAARNIHLELEGPIDWQFYPELGLSLEGVLIAPLQQPEQPLARAEQGTAAVALLPLLSRRVEVDQILLEGLAIHLVVDEQGRGNWESLGGDSGDTGELTEDSDTADRGALNASVERISIRNGSLGFEDRQTGQTARLEDIDLQLTDVNLDQRPFPVTAELLLTTSQLPQPLSLRFDGKLQGNETLDDFALAQSRFQAHVPQADNAGLTAALEGRVNLTEGLAYQGRVAVEDFNPKAFFNALGQPLPPTADPEALTQLSLAAPITGTGAGIRSEELSLTLDQTHLAGSLVLTLPEGGVPKVNAELNGNTISLDRYLPPEGSEAVEDGSTPGDSDGDAPLPLESLRAVNADLAIAMNEILVMEMPVADSRLALRGENGLWELTELSANFYEGTLQAQGQLDARAEREDTAAMELSTRMEGLSLHPLLMDFADFGDLSGLVTGELQARTKASTSGQLLDNLSAAFAFTSPQLTFQGVNAEYFYCQMATQLDDKDMPDTNWPARTQIDEVEGRLLFENSRLSIASLVAYVENLVITATGYLDLDSMDYRIRVPMRLAQQQTSPAGCLVESNFLLNRDVDVLGCSGSLNNTDFGEQCGLDRDAVANLAKEAIRYNVEKQVTEEKQEVREKLQEKLRESLGDEEADDARDLLRDLLKR